MSEVFKANVLGPDGFTRTVALKRILPHISHDPSFVEMFVDEAKISSQLHHPNICNVYSFGRIDSSYFLAMEYIAGQSLRETIKAYAVRQESMPLPVALHIIKNLCDALYYAHTLTDRDGKFLQIVHRDVKPSNILISYLGAVKLIDFGIARAKGRLSITNGSFRKGTWAYMAPEQTGDHPLDHRTDIFGLGLVLYELLTGQSVYPKITTNELLDLVKSAKIAPPSSVNPKVDKALDEITMRALRPQPADRYADMREMEQAISDYEDKVELRCTQRDLTFMMESLFSTEITGEKQGSPGVLTLNQPKKDGVDAEDTQRYADPPSMYFEDSKSNISREIPLDPNEDTSMAEGDSIQEGSSHMIKSAPSSRGIQPWVVILLGGILLLLIGVILGILFWQRPSHIPAAVPPGDRVAEKVSTGATASTVHGAVEEKVHRETSFKITSEPPGSTIAVFHQNREISLANATTPTTIPGIQEGDQYIIRLSKEGYVTTERETRWKAGDPTTLHFLLIPLAKRSAVDPQRYVDPERASKKNNLRRGSLKKPRGKRGEFMAKVSPLDENDEPEEKPSAPPLSPEPKSVSPNPAKTEPPKTVAVKDPPPKIRPPKEEKPRAVTPAPTVGKLVVLSLIPGYIFINSSNTGKITPATFMLPPGPYEVVVVLRQSNTRIKHSVTVQAGKSYRLRFKGAK